MENFTIKSMYLKLRNEFRAVVRCTNAAFYKPDYEKLLMCPLNKRLGRAFVSKHAAEHLKRSTELLKQSDELLSIWEKTKSSGVCLKSMATCLCCNTANAVPISHGSKCYQVVTIEILLLHYTSIVKKKEHWNSNVCLNFFNPYVYLSFFSSKMYSHIVSFVLCFIALLF